MPPPVHGPQESARLREGMLAEIQGLSADTAAAWAKTMLGVKNRLTADDARQIEAAFEAHLASLPADPLEHQPGQESGASTAGRAGRWGGRIECVPGNRCRSANGHHPEDRAPPEQGAPAVCQDAALPDLRPATCRRPSSAICAAPGLGPQGQR